MEVTHNGITDTIFGWARRTGISSNTLYGRIGMGWDLERVFSTRPLKRRLVNLATGTKVCCDCETEKPLTEFYPRRSLGPNRYFSRCKPCDAKYIKGVRQGEREQVIAHYSGGSNKCAHCPENRLAALDLDHINGGGTRERKATGRSSQEIYRHAIRDGFPEGFQVLCRNCNWIKHLTDAGWG